MNQQDAIMAVLAAIGRGEVDLPEHYELLAAAVELGIRAVYRAGLEVAEKNGTKEIPRKDGR
jgi:hypothetical protein